MVATREAGDSILDLLPDIAGRRGKVAGGRIGLPVWGEDGHSFQGLPHRLDPVVQLGLRTTGVVLRDDLHQTTGPVAGLHPWRGA
jgi:hypothetical protein